MRGDAQFYGKFSPVAKNGIPDYKRGTSKWYDWLDEQEHYCLNGYQAGGDKIQGKLYFKLNFFTLLHLGDDGYEKAQYPFYVTVQKELYDLIADCQNTGWDLIVGKGRDKGFSYDLANIALYEMTFRENTSILALFPGGKSKARQKFKEKYDLAWNYLIDDWKQYPDLSNAKDSYRYGWEETDPETGRKSEKGSLNTLNMVEAVSADVGKSGRFKWIFLEEFGELKDPLNLIVTNRANMQKGAKKFGTTIAGGTSNAFNEGYKDFLELWYNHNSYKFHKFFIPAQKAYWGFVNYKTGESYDEEALDDIMKNREGLKGDKLMIEMQNYPTTEKEMFISIKQSPFDSLLISEQQDRILTTKEIQASIEVGNIFCKVDGSGNFKAEFSPTPSGRWRMHIRPEKGLLAKDVGAVDPYRLGNVQESDSKGAIVVYRPFQGVTKLGNLPICVYHYRHSDKTTFFQDCLATAVYYDCQLLIEHTDDDIFKFFLERNAARYLKTKPKLVHNPYSKGEYQFGIKPTEFARGTAIEYAVSEFTQNYEKIPYLELLEELSNFGSKNTDLAMAYIWAILHARDNIKVLDDFRRQSLQKKGFSLPYLYEDESGRTHVVSNAEAQEFLNSRNGIFRR